MKLAIISACLTAIGLGWAFEDQQVKDPLYQQTSAQVSAVLDKADLPAMVFGVKALSARHWRADNNTSIWALQSDDKVELLRLSASTIKEGNGTRVRYDVLPPEGALREQVSTRLKESGAFRNLYLAALAEQIDANLNNRKFDISRISSETARVTLEELPHFREAAEAAVADNNRRRQEVIDRAYINEK
jgi:hypothetical protein